MLLLSNISKITLQCEAEEMPLADSQFDKQSQAWINRTEQKRTFVRVQEPKGQLTHKTEDIKLKNYDNKSIKQSISFNSGSIAEKLGY